MARSSRSRRRGVRLIIIGLVLIVASFLVLLLTIPSRGLGSPTPTESPTQTVDYIGIAALVSSAGGFFAGVISAVTGLILALKRPGKAPEPKGTVEAE
jgi:hypothetical protein